MTNNVSTNTLSGVAIEIKNLTVRAGEKVILDNINLTIKEGDFVALIGPNGSGKTTLLKAILGYIAPERGTIKVFGKPPDHEFKIGYIPQKLNFEKSLVVSVREFLSLGVNPASGLFFKCCENPEKEFREIFEKLRLEHLLDTPIFKLSGGELQKVLIMFSLLEKPALLLMDEATEGVDLPTERVIYEVLSKERAKRKLTVVMVSHDLAMVSREATRVIAIGGGKVCCEGVPNEVLTDESLRKAYGVHSTPYCHHH